MCRHSTRCIALWYGQKHAPRAIVGGGVDKMYFLFVDHWRHKLRYALACAPNRTAIHGHTLPLKYAWPVRSAYYENDCTRLCVWRHIKMWHTYIAHTNATTIEEVTLMINWQRATSNSRESTTTWSNVSNEMNVQYTQLYACIGWCSCVAAHTWGSQLMEDALLEGYIL